MLQLLMFVVVVVRIELKITHWSLKTILTYGYYQIQRRRFIIGLFRICRWCSFRLCDKAAFLGYDIKGDYPVDEVLGELLKVI